MIVNLFISTICQLTGYQKSTEAQQAGRLVKKLMKISIFRIQLFSDTVTFRAGRVGVDPQTNFVKRAGRVEKTVGGPTPPDTVC